MSRRRGGWRAGYRPFQILGLALGLAWPPWFATPALAWGYSGHRASARVTESLLTPTARAAVRAILDEGENLAEAAVWADVIRPKRPESGPWHYVNVPIDAPGYSDSHCPEAGCVVRKAEELRVVLTDPNLPLEQKREALRFLIHFVQDLHQPVHVGHRNDRGGNDLQLQFFGQGTNLHRIWDFGMMKKHLDSERAWVEAIRAEITPERTRTWSAWDVSRWANESHSLARLAYEKTPGGPSLKSGDRLEQDYLDRHIPIVKLRLAQAAVRLAQVLNELFPEPAATPLPAPQVNPRP